MKQSLPFDQQVQSPEIAVSEVIVDPEEEKRRKQQERREKIRQKLAASLGKDNNNVTAPSAEPATIKPSFTSGRPVEKGLAMSLNSGMKSKKQSSKRVLLEVDDEPVAVPELDAETEGQQTDQLTNENIEIDSKMKTHEEDGIGEDEDPLEMFMSNVSVEIQQLEKRDAAVREKQKPSAKKLQEWLDEEIEEEPEVDFLKQPEKEVEISLQEIMAEAAEKNRRVDVLETDHSTINYEPFRKDFYIEPPEIKQMTQKQADELRIELDGIKIRGKVCPKPVQRWSQFGLPPGCDDIIKKILKFDRPSPIQCQAIPALMSGRDLIGVARTGSGKTIAFLLPMFRHIKDQRPCVSGDGPIGLILTPTRELATQIYKECKNFLKILNLRAVCCYGGAPLKEQIADLKRGCEIIICTPGRIIELLCSNGGRITNLRRVTYLCLDEADRMFDLGFEPQVMKIIANVRPDRQTMLFSATFPRKMEALAYKILKNPLGITVGARSVVSPDVTQIVEVHANEDSKFLRLLAILGQTSTVSEYGKSLIFVDRQDSADTLMSNLMARSYPCQSIHGGKDQSDRDQTILDFKSGAINILIATSIAARGLDVKELLNVINYDCPNHMEDYVHRCGRTGRAGNKGTAYTFITPDQERYAADIVKALKNSNVPIPFDLRELLENYEAKKRVNQVTGPTGGFGGKGRVSFIFRIKTT